MDENYSSDPNTLVLPNGQVETYVRVDRKLFEEFLGGKFAILMITNLKLT